MQTPSAALRVAWLTVLAGCGSGCDGGRAKPPETPHVPIATTDPGSGAEVVAAVEPTAPQVVDPPVTQTHGYLVVPPGALDKLNGALLAAERLEPSARVGMVFFGDSHTAGDAMTSRLRSTFQGRFGDAGRGLVQAGKPSARHYYQRDV